MKARIALQTDFISQNLGFDVISRETLVESVSEMANHTNGEKNQATFIAIELKTSNAKRILLQ